MSDEYFDILDESGNLTGEKRLRSEAHTLGLWHRTVHIYFFRKINDDIEILVHLRSATKDLKPNCWDTRFGGHIKSGETIEQTVAEEIQEETGLAVNESDLLKGPVRKSDHFPNREFTNSFFLEYKDDENKLKFNDGEVQQVKWVKVNDIIESIKNNPEQWAPGMDSMSVVTEFLRSMSA